MKNKKGFTLIELLAVIVILAIIALIATPLILNTIEKSRKNSAKDSMYGYVEAIESQNALYQLDSEKYQEVSSGDVSTINSKIKVKGTKPTSGTVTIEKGTVTAATLCVNGYTVTYNGKEVTNTEKGCGESSSNAPTYTAYSIGEPIQINGTDWYVLADSSTSESTVKLISKWNINKDANAASTSSNLFVTSSNDSSFEIAFDTNGSNVYENSSIKAKLEGDFKSAIENALGITVNSIGLFSQVDAEAFGCEVYNDFIGCPNDEGLPILSSTFRSWTNIPVGTNLVFFSTNYGNFALDEHMFPVNQSNYDGQVFIGVKPVITIEKSELQ